MPTAQLTVPVGAGPRQGVGEDTVQLTVDTEQASTMAARLIDTLRAAVDLPIHRMVIDGEPPAQPPQIPRQRATLRILTDSRRVLVQDSLIELTRLEFDLLSFLCRNPGRVHRRSTLLAEVWGIAEHLGSRTVDVHVRRLRCKIGPDFDPITTVRGVGYLIDRDAGFAIESS